MALDIEKLRKVWALYERGLGGEKEAAKSRAESMVAPFGMGLEDIPYLLQEHQPDPMEELFRRYQRGAQDRESRQREEAAKKAREREEEKRRQQEARKAARDRETAWRRAHKKQVDEIIKRRGGYEKVFENTPEEQILIDAASPWYVREELAGGAYTEKWDGKGVYERWTDRVMNAIRSAIPSPTTIDEAIAEYRRWDHACEERSMVYRYKNRCGCDADFTPAVVWARKSHVADLARWELPARSVQELMVRVQFQIEYDQINHREQESILRDLARIQAQHADERKVWESAAKESPKPPKARRRKGKTAKDRRADVEGILASSDGQKMTLRRVAEMVGVSPATVLNIKRKMDSLRSN